MDPLTTETVGESQDGNGAGDHDEAYEFGYRLSVANPRPFSERTFARLMVLRSRVDGGDFGAGDLRSEPLSDEVMVPPPPVLHGIQPPLDESTFGCSD